MKLFNVQLPKSKFFREYIYIFFERQEFLRYSLQRLIKALASSRTSVCSTYHQNTFLPLFIGLLIALSFLPFTKQIFISVS
jgi:hypothetical protein